MGGFYGVASKNDCVADLFYGTDYHSHLGTVRGGLAVKNGQGFIADLGASEKQVAIRNIYLAYYENQSPQNYLQPIYVFESETGFTAYVPAIDSTWLD